MAPVWNRFTRLSTLSTSSMGTGSPAGTNCRSARSVWGLPASSTMAVYCLNFS